MGGVVIFSTMDPLQLCPVQGRPAFLSPHLLTSFDYLRLNEYVRSCDDENRQEIQNLARKHIITQEDVDCFWLLIDEFCTLVDTIDDTLIRPNMLRIFSKKEAI